MILVKLNKEEFGYDIHSLVKAFYPGQTVIVTADEEKIAQKEAMIAEGQSETGEEISFCVVIRYLNEEPVGENPGYGNILEIDGQQFDFCNDDRRLAKNALKKALYTILVKRTKKALPWGNLTGIRPAKIPMSLLDQGESEESIRQYMKDTYFVSDKKIALCMEIAEKERGILQEMDYENGYSLYIGIPFCPTTCLYCSFPSYAAALWQERMPEYLDCVEKELDFIARNVSDKRLQTVYIGGGTPTTLPPKLLDRLLNKIEMTFDFTDVREFTVEAGRPDSITTEKLAVMRKYPVSRISINPQTMKQQTLDLIGRRHTVEQVKESFWLAREAGFDNINMDLIVGLPEEEYADVERTMQEIAKLAPDSVTVHSLAVKRSARLNIEKENYRDLHMVNTQEIIGMTEEKCRQMGMFPYYLYRQKNMAGNFENVGYAKAGKEGYYNILVMEDRQTVLAVGAGAMTKFVNGKERTRVENVKDIASYLNRIDEMTERKKRFMADYL